MASLIDGDQPEELDRFAESGFGVAAICWPKYSDSVGQKCSSDSKLAQIDAIAALALQSYAKMTVTPLSRTELNYSFLFHKNRCLDDVAILTFLFTGQCWALMNPRREKQLVAAQPDPCPPDPARRIIKQHNPYMTICC